MQVRADTRSCEAFSALQQPPKPTSAQAARKAPPPPKRQPEPTGLCNWGRLLLIAAIIILILLIAWGSYTCFSGSSSPTPTPTPVPTPGPTPTGILPTPTPVITPPPITYYSLGTWVNSPPWLIIASKVQKATSILDQVAAAPNTNWVVVTVTVQYTGNGTASVSAPYFTLWDKYGTHYPPVKPMTSVGNWFPYEVPAILRQGQVASGIIVFQVPTIASGLSIRTQIGEYTVAWNLGL
jgi:hypothetical protein